MQVVLDLFTVRGGINGEQDYTEVCQKSKMKCFAKRVNRFIFDEAKNVLS